MMNHAQTNPAPNQPTRQRGRWFYRLVRRWWNRPEWEYGTCEGRRARRHRKTGEVQFELWLAGEAGHEKTCWHNFHRNWWKHFEPNVPDQPHGK